MPKKKTASQKKRDMQNNSREALESQRVADRRKMAAVDGAITMEQLDIVTWEEG